MPKETSRRAILSGLAALPAVGAVPAAAALPDPAAAAFEHWLDYTFWYNRTEFDDDSDSAMAPIAEQHFALERAIFDLPPSAPAAAAIALTELAYVLDCPGEEQSLAEFKPGTEAFVYLAILRCLQPVLSGRMAEITADLLDNPGQKVTHLLLARSLGWRLSEDDA